MFITELLNASRPVTTVADDVSPTELPGSVAQCYCRTHQRCEHPALLSCAQQVNLFVRLTGAIYATEFLRL